MQTVLDKGQDADWFSAQWIRWFSLVSIAAFVAFVLWELRSSHPIADLRVFKNRNFAVGNALVCVTAVLIYGPLTLMPLFLQNLMGYSSLSSGLAQTPRGLGTLLASVMVGSMVNHFDSRKLIGIGMFTMGVSCVMLGGLNLEFAPVTIYLPQFLQGVGLALVMVPLMTVTMATIPNEQMGNATGIHALARNLAGSIGISLVTTMATRGAQIHQATLVTHATPYDLAYQIASQTAQTSLAPQVGTAQAAAIADGMIYKTISQQSYMLAYVDDFIWLALVCFVAVPMVILLKKAQGRKDLMLH